MVEKIHFLQVVNFSYPKNRFLVSLRSFFSAYKSFPGRVSLIPVSTCETEDFSKKMNSLACLKKVIYFPSKLPKLAIFGYLVPPSKSIFSRYRQNSKNSLFKFLENVVRNMVLYLEFSIFAGLRWGNRFACRLFPKSVNLP